MTSDPRTRASRVELVILPAIIPGKSCASCAFYDHGRCTNPQVALMVDAHWSCKLWHRDDVTPVAGHFPLVPVTYARGVQPALYMTDENSFHQMLDANPNDHLTRQVFADWLGERGDPRAAGYRALGQLQRHTYGLHGGGYYWHNRNLEVAPFVNQRNMLPEDWHQHIEDQRHLLVAGLAGVDVADRPYYTYHPSRRHAEDAAAIAFAHLPPERQAEILAPPPAQFARYERRNAPPGLTYNDKAYRTGQFIPGTVMFQHSKPRGDGSRPKPVQPASYADDPYQIPDVQRMRAGLFANPLDPMAHRVFADRLQDELGEHPDVTFRRAVADSVERRLGTPWTAPQLARLDTLPGTVPHGPLDAFRQPVSATHDSSVWWNSYPAFNRGDRDEPDHWYWAGGPEQQNPPPRTSDVREWMRLRRAREWPGISPTVGFDRPGEVEDLHPSERAYAGIDNLENVDPALWPQIEAIMRDQFDRAQRLSRYAQPAGFREVQPAD